MAEESFRWPWPFAACLLCSCASSPTAPEAPQSEPAPSAATARSPTPTSTDDGAGHDGRQHHGHPSADRHPHEDHHQSSDHYEHDFSDVDKHAKAFDADDRDAWQKPAEVVRVAAIQPGQTVIDLGVGTGYFMPHLSTAVGSTGKVLALDVEPKMVEHAAKRAKEGGWANVVATLVPADGPGLDAASVDRVLVVNTWHHIPSRAAYSARLAAVLKPGGSVVVVDFTEDAPFGPPKHARLTAEQVGKELAAGGLSPEVASETLPYQYIVVGRK